MSNTKKVYPAKPTFTNVSAKYGTPDNPTMTDHERAVVQANFAEIFLFGPTDNDPYTLLAHRVGNGTTRQRAKQLYWVFIHQQKGYFFEYVKSIMGARGMLAHRIKKYTEFLDNPETVYQILCRAEDEADEAKEKRDAMMGRRKQGEARC